MAGKISLDGGYHTTADVHIWKDFNEIGDKQRSKVENLAKYVHL
jgi:hypothetical protein